MVTRTQFCSGGLEGSAPIVVGFFPSTPLDEDEEKRILLLATAPAPEFCLLLLLLLWVPFVVVVVVGGGAKQLRPAGCEEWWWNASDVPCRIWTTYRAAVLPSCDHQTNSSRLQGSWHSRLNQTVWQ